MQSIEHTKKLGRRYELVRAYYEYGIFLKRVNQIEKAIYNWRQGWKISKDIGAKAYIKRYENLFGYKTQTEEKEAEDTPRERLNLFN